MRTIGIGVTTAFSLILAGVVAEAETLRIEHRSVPCAVAGQHPRIEATIEPATEVASARVLFHGEGAADWYALDMRRVSATWSATLPRPTAGAARFAYYIVARGQESHVRLPEASAFIVDVATTCPVGGLPVEAQSRIALGVPAGAPRLPKGFDARGIQDYLEYAPDDESAPPAAPSASYAFPQLEPMARVRIKTAPPPLFKEKVVREDASTVTVSVGGQPRTLTKSGGELEGKVMSIEDGSLILSFSNSAKTARVRMQDIVSLQVQQPGSAALGAVGGLAGAAAGCVVGVLACVSVTDCESVAPLWIATGVGAVAGAAMGGSPDWKSVILARQGAMALTLEPRRHGAAVGVGVSF
jgi:hypothetical protein